MAEERIKPFKEFLMERLCKTDLIKASILRSPERQHYDAKIDKIYSFNRGISPDLYQKEIHFVGGPSSWGNTPLNVNDHALVFIRKINGIFYECAWRGHILLEEIEGELNAVFQMPNNWPMDGVPTEVIKGLREDPRSHYCSIIPFRLLEPYIQQLVSEETFTKKLRYHQYWLKCANCEEESRFPVYEHDGYMLMRNPKNEADCRLWNWDDQTSKEVNQLAKKYEAIILADLVKNALHKKIIRNSVPIEQKCFSHICDPSNGIKYHLNTEAVCPHCHSHNIQGWGPTENPYETIDLEIPYITHHHWDSLNQEEKEKIIHDEVYRLVTEKLQELEERDNQKIDKP